MCVKPTTTFNTSSSDRMTNFTAGKATRVGVPSQDEEVVMSSSQQLGKPYKTSTVAVVTKPVAVSSAAPASHVVRVGLWS